MTKNNLQIPVWLLAICAFTFIAIILEQLYWRKTPVDLWGLKLNQPESSTNTEMGIILSESVCSELDGDWQAFQAAAGRTIIVSGAATDENGTTNKFVSLDVGGTYTHTLSVDEMPRHAHGQVWGQTNGNLGGRASGNNVTSYTRQKMGDTLAVGGGKPHNNIPPYIVLNLCTPKIK